VLVRLDHVAQLHRKPESRHHVSGCKAWRRRIALLTAFDSPYQNRLNGSASEISGDVEDAPEHIQFLKRELNFSRVHRLRKHRRGLIGGKTHAQATPVRKKVATVFQNVSRLTKKTSKVESRGRRHIATV
jgi:hypothetical protein